MIDVEPQNTAVPEFTLKENIPHPCERTDQVRLVQTQSSLLSLNILDGDVLSLGVFECDVTFRAVARNQFHHGEDNERDDQQCHNRHHRTNHNEL